jgi:uncharacterized membrane protein YoaK (UPF0700 family)
MRLFLLALLALNAGYVDAAGFLALHGLFTTHVTGNFVTLGASFAFGTTGVVAKLLALPTFCVVILLARTLGLALDRKGWPALRLTFLLQAALLALGAWMFLTLGPFPDGDAAPAVVTGLVVVSAMAIQNALHRTRLSALPPSTVLTGPIAQMMIDIADVRRGLPPEKRAAIRTRIGLTAMAVAAFAAGCGAAAFAYVHIHEYCFAVAPIIALVAFAATWANDEI